MNAKSSDDKHTYKISEKRKAHRNRVVLVGKVVSIESGVSFDCAIHQITQLGAKISVSHGVIPAQAYLIDIRNATAYEFSVVWQKPPYAGLKFLSSYSLRELTEQELRTDPELQLVKSLSVHLV